MSGDGFDIFSPADEDDLESGAAVGVGCLMLLMIVGIGIVLGVTGSFA